MSLARKAAILICAVFPLWAAPPLTTIKDTIYKADGTMFNGTAVVSWMPFDADDTSKIGLQSLTVKIINGAIRVQLVPNSDSTPVNSYTVQYQSDGKQQFTETWSVPPSTSTLRIKDVRVTPTNSSGGGPSGGGVVQPPSQTPINESSVIGLLTDLSLRPVRGATFTTGTAAIIDDTGAVGSVQGNLSDCVRVDGTSGACYDSTLAPAFVDYETPGGAINGSNASFTLANTPSPATSLSLYRNGLVQQAGLDYNIQSDGSILFVPVSVPQTGDVLMASYRTAPTSSTSEVVSHQVVQAPAMQILCSGSGAGTTNVNDTLLGSCTIPANTLAAGDRVEVRFGFSHQGTANGYNFQVHWGRTALVRRTASARDRVVTGHGDASIGTGEIALDMQTWGTALPLTSVVASSSDPLNADITVNFQGAMAAAGADSVTLENFTVLRYPAH
jgi:hypothetical protein